MKRIIITLLLIGIVYIAQAQYIYINKDFINKYNQVIPHLYLKPSITIDGDNITTINHLYLDSNFKYEVSIPNDIPIDDNKYKLPYSGSTFERGDAVDIIGYSLQMIKNEILYLNPKWTANSIIIITN